ncbi:MAG: methylated-DNA--[protein]-cysteine S-methyltransferase [Limnobacter sp.]|uniref:methylated-DNA--[protein]-cysteine S-methyltransferase n=1 Tax=Limnobacter sp. TaxID=2003368 RepID=UPI0032EC984C
MTQFETGSHYRLIEQAIRILENNAINQINIADHCELQLMTLADQLNISPFYLQRLFTTWAGISPKQFFQSLQKDHARTLLQTGHTTLSASIELGFKSTSKLHQLMLKFEALTPGEIKQLGEGQIFTLGQAASPLGNTFVCLTSKGINSLEFETETLDYEQWRAGIAQLYPKAQLQESNSKAHTTINKIFSSNAREKNSFTLHLRGTPFQLQVWQALLHLPPGSFASYQQIAQHIGKPKASRAVGSAIAKNPVGYLIPCHRVIQATGELGQYRWNSTRKKALHLWEQGLISQHTK